jgi:hypothetical protein
VAWKRVDPRNDLRGASPWLPVDVDGLGSVLAVVEPKSLRVLAD